MDFLRPGLKKGVGNGIFWSEIGSGFGNTGGPPPRGKTLLSDNLCSQMLLRSTFAILLFIYLILDKGTIGCGLV